MLGALAYLLISGAAFATVRSYIMISIMFLAVMLDRPALALRNVALAALRDPASCGPRACSMPGFQMSFAAVVALVSAYEWLRGRDEERGACAAPRRARAARAVLRRHRRVDAGGEPGGGALRHLSFPQHAAVRDSRQPDRHPDLQPDRDAGGAGGPGGDAVRAGGGAAVGDGAGASRRWCGAPDAVASLPGAVGRVPAIPTTAFVLMVAGGLWCALWSTRWRVLGVVPIALGLMLAPTGQRPDVLVGRGAELVAVRGGPTASCRRWRAAAPPSSWRAGWSMTATAGRQPKPAKAQAFCCDKLGLHRAGEGHAHRRQRSAAALRDDCAMASILVLQFSKPKGCRPPGTMIDRDDVDVRGAHALTIDDGRVVVETVAETRGDRPWAERRDTNANAADEDDRPAPTIGPRAGGEPSMRCGAVLEVTVELVLDVIGGLPPVAAREWVSDCRCCSSNRPVPQARLNGSPGTASRAPGNAPIREARLCSSCRIAPRLELVKCP